MPRVLGVDIPNNKPTYISLSYLYGIGPFLAIQICYELGVDPHVRAGELSEDEVSRITTHLGKTLAGCGRFSAIAAFVTERDCRFVGSERRPMPELARVVRRLLRVKRALRI